MALPDLPGKRSYLKSSGFFLPSGHKFSPHPATVQNPPASLFFSIKKNVTITILTAEKGEGSLCFGFCLSSLEPNKMTPTMVPRAKSLPKCGLPENSKLHRLRL